MASTGDCFEPLSINQLAGEPGRFGAVGEPDRPLAEPFAAHCDDADYLNIPGYPQSRSEATKVLGQCVALLKSRVQDGISAAEQLLNDKDQINPEQVRSLAPKTHFYKVSCLKI